MCRYIYNCIGVAVVSTYTTFIMEWDILMGLEALLAYEWCITFPDEVNLFWRNKKSLATWLFVLNRYLPLLYQTMLWVNDVVISEKVCTPCAYIIEQ